jgi:DNA-directed RNA polymerase subunit M/transcription elongation factor TFIIS
MPTGESRNPSPRQAKETCVAHQCPKCGTDHHVSVEQVLRGDTMVTWCHCRACGHSWHPVAQKARES